MYIFIVQDIRSRNHYVVDDCFTEMLSHWLSRPSPPPSWSALAKALTSHVIGHLDIAGTIKLDSEPDCDESMLESSKKRICFNTMHNSSHSPCCMHAYVYVLNRNYKSLSIRWLHAEGGKKNHMGHSLRVEKSWEPTAN